jgi:hypothetical protein
MAVMDIALLNEYMMILYHSVQYLPDVFYPFKVFCFHKAGAKTGDLFLIPVNIPALLKHGLWKGGNSQMEVLFGRSFEYFPGTVSHFAGFS